MGRKVFEVKTADAKKESKEYTVKVSYVTSEENSLLSVAKHFTEHCEQYEEELLSVREVINIVEHITVADKG